MMHEISTTCKWLNSNWFDLLFLKGCRIKLFSGHLSLLLWQFPLTGSRAIDSCTCSAAALYCTAVKSGFHSFPYEPFASQNSFQYRILRYPFIKETLLRRLIFREQELSLMSSLWYSVVIISYSDSCSFVLNSIYILYKLNLTLSLANMFVTYCWWGSISTRD